MSLFLYLVSIALSSTLAVSTPISSDPSYQRLLPSNSSSLNPAEFGQRSNWDIVWGCLTTIFACSWVSVHPHIPPPDFGWLRITLMRFELMVWTILAPEVIILLAARQWLAARKLKKQYRERGWTKTHGFFIQMGGFMLFDNGVRKGVISPHRFETLVKNQQITFPEITEEEIKDRSKGDGLSKGLILVQVAWFIIQFTARTTDGLAVTQLELVTFAFATLNGFMYFFWWNKPLDIRLPIPIHLLHLPQRINEDIARSSEANTEYSASEPHFLRSISLTAIPSANNISNTNGHFRRDSWVAIIKKAWFSRFYVIANNPDVKLLDTMSVPIFFSSAVPPDVPIGLGYSIAIVLGMVFGAIHCAGWNLAFPSVTEGYIWRIASVIIVAYPTLFTLAPVIEVLVFIFRNTSYSYCLDTIWGVIFLFILLPIYMMARIFILLEAFLALRNLPETATYAVQWTTFLPHV